MRIVHVSNSDLAGGASISAYRVHRALVDAGVESRFLVSHKVSDDPTVSEIFPRRGATLRRRWRERLDELPLWRYPRRTAQTFSLNWASNGAWRTINAARPSVVHLHWVTNGLLPLRHFSRLAAPLVWNLWDQWAFTGGCHYSGRCDRYTQSCGRCPALESQQPDDISAKTLAKKHRAWSNLRIPLIAPSEWLAAKARTSALFRQHECRVFAQPVDTRVFRPLPSEQARTLLKLELDASIIVVGASELGEGRKGFDLAVAALQKIDCSDRHKIVLGTFGAAPPNLPARIGNVVVRHLGRLRDELTVALAFSAADVALVPSREDAGPQITVEALACGTPVVGFPVGVTADLVRHQQNGYLATPFDSNTLADGLQWALERRGDLAIRGAARRAAVEFADVHGQVPRYLEIYRRVGALVPAPP